MSDQDIKQKLDQLQQELNNLKSQVSDKPTKPTPSKPSNYPNPSEPGKYPYPGQSNPELKAEMRKKWSKSHHEV